MARAATRSCASRTAVARGRLADRGRRSQPSATQAASRPIRDAVRSRQRRPRRRRRPTCLDAVFAAVRDHASGATSTVDRHRTHAPSAGERTITYAEAVREAIGQAMEADERVFMLGEDIGVYGGAFGVSGDLSTGSAASGSATPRSPSSASSARPSARPWPACARSSRSSSPTSPTRRWTRSSTRPRRSTSCSAARRTVPMVLRAPSGSGTGAAAQHSQSLEAWFAHVPGLKVVMPATAGGRQGPAARPRSTTRTRSSCSSTSCSTAHRARCPRTPCGCRSARPPYAARGADLTIVATGVMVSPRARGRRDARRRGHRGHGDRPAHAQPARRRTDPATTSRPPVARCWSRRRPATPASSPRSPRGSPSRRRSTGCWRRSSGSAAWTPRSRTPRSSRGRRSRRSTTSSTPPDAS